MPMTGCGVHFSKHLSNEDFNRLSSFIHSSIGIKMPEQKMAMLESRLRKRLRSLDMASFTDYCDYLFSADGIENEFYHLIDVVTTNKTEFFRATEQFNALYHTVLPEMTAGRYTHLALWSAACSTGEEPYSIAMAVEQYAMKHPECRFNYKILATDISLEALSKARSGIYEEKLVENIPIELRVNYLLQSKDRVKKLVRIIPELKNKITFRMLNLMDKDFELNGKMDIIFCRNAIMYFDRKTQAALLTRLCGSLNPGGYLFMGHTEILAGMNLPVKLVAPTVYRKMTDA